MNDNPDNPVIEEEYDLLDMRLAAIAILNATKTYIKDGDNIHLNWTNSEGTQLLIKGLFQLKEQYCKMQQNSLATDSIIKRLGDEKEFLNRQIEDLKKESSTLHLLNSELKKLRENNLYELQSPDPLWVARHEIKEKVTYLGLTDKGRRASKRKPQHYTRVETLKEAIKFSKRGRLLALCQNMKRNKIDYENVVNPQLFKVCKIVLVEEN